MVFSSLRFFLFLAAVLAVLTLPLSARKRKTILCAASCLFYAAWDYRYLVLLLLISGIDFWCARQIARTEYDRSRRAWLTFSIASNLAILGYFKYAGFFLTNVNDLVVTLGGHALPLLHVFLPAGISFYTFKSMSYTIDVYRRELEPARSLLEYAMFVTLFPDLIAGPIVRASVFLPQLDRDPGPTWARLREGSSLFLVGLGKKLLVADHCAVIADAVFAAPQTWSCFDAWCGLLAYTLQIYCDFSGYSDMAIGVARMIGYDLPENFRMPYLARNVTEFWRRWHMTLSFWLRDYVYISLGGNRHGEGRTNRNLLFTMLIGGLWHGAGWNFVIWGGLHGAALVVHRVWRSRGDRPRIPAVVSWALTLLFVMLCWVPFRAPDWTTTLAFFRALSGLGAGRYFWTPAVLFVVLPIVLAGHAIGVAIEQGWSARLERRLDADVRRDIISGPYLVFRARTVAGAFVVAASVLTIYFFGATDSSPFIYFQF